jgi:hypothetical protein
MFAFHKKFSQLLQKYLCLSYAKTKSLHVSQSLQLKGMQIFEKHGPGSMGLKAWDNVSGGFSFNSDGYSENYAANKLPLSRQGCQMVYFQTQNSHMGIF